MVAKVFAPGGMALELPVVPIPVAAPPAVAPAFTPMALIAQVGAENALFFAAQQCDLPLLQAVIEYGVDVNAADVGGHTALLYAAVAHRPNSIMAMHRLLAAGADPRREDNKGLSALKCVLADDNVAMLALFRAHHVLFTEESLLFAWASGSRRSVKWLAQHNSECFSKLYTLARTQMEEVSAADFGKIKLLLRICLEVLPSKKFLSATEKIADEKYAHDVALAAAQLQEEERESDDFKMEPPYLFEFLDSTDVKAATSSFFETSLQKERTRFTQEELLDMLEGITTVDALKDFFNTKLDALFPREKTFVDMLRAAAEEAACVIQ